MINKNQDQDQNQNQDHPLHLLLHLLRIDLAHVTIPIGLPHFPGTSLTKIPEIS